MRLIEARSPADAWIQASQVLLKEGNNLGDINEILNLVIEIVKSDIVQFVDSCEHAIDLIFQQLGEFTIDKALERVRKGAGASRASHGAVRVRGLAVSCGGAAFPCTRAKIFGARNF